MMLKGTKSVTNALLLKVGRLSDSQALGYGVNLPPALKRYLNYIGVFRRCPNTLSWSKQMSKSAYGNACWTSVEACLGFNGPIALFQLRKKKKSPRPGMMIIMKD